MNKELPKLLIEQQKNELFHKSITDEFRFYKDIQNGNLEVLKGSMDIEPTSEMGTLSKNHFRNLQYHLIILIAMITRFCVEGGMDSETAYTMSDMYIRKVDISIDEKELSEIKKAVIIDFTTAMHNLHEQQPSCNYHVTKAVDYIKKHLTEHIRRKQIAAELNISPDHLNRLFKKEFNIPVSEYILRQKCIMARYMLENSISSCSEIGAFLGFSSASHFTECFKKVNNLTPDAYRKQKSGISDAF